VEGPYNQAIVDSRLHDTAVHLSASKSVHVYQIHQAMLVRVGVSSFASGSEQCRTDFCLSQSAETLREVAAFSTNENEKCLFKAQSKIEWQPVCLAIVFR
jgi:hypothetical protein